MKHFGILGLIAWCLALVGCASTSDGTAGFGVVAQVTAGPPGGDTRPEKFVAYDSNVFCAWADTNVTATLLLRPSWGALYPPVQVFAGGAVVQVRQTGFVWRGVANEPLPSVAEVLFSPWQVQSWGLRFTPPE